MISFVKFLCEAPSTYGVAAKILPYLDKMGLHYNENAAKTTNSTYISAWKVDKVGEQIGDEIRIRVSDHEPNVAAYGKSDFYINTKDEFSLAHTIKDIANHFKLPIPANIKSVLTKEINEVKHRIKIAQDEQTRLKNVLKDEKLFWEEAQKRVRAHSGLWAPSYHDLSKINDQQRVKVKTKIEAQIKGGIVSTEKEIDFLKQKLKTML